jgi:hypothetical protein
MLEKGVVPSLFIGKGRKHVTDSVRTSTKGEKEMLKDEKMKKGSRGSLPIVAIQWLV